MTEADSPLVLLMNRVAAAWRGAGEHGDDQRDRGKPHSCPRFPIGRQRVIFWMAITATLGGTPRTVNRTASPTETASLNLRGGDAKASWSWRA